MADPQSLPGTLLETPQSPQDGGIQAYAPTPSLTSGQPVAGIQAFPSVDKPAIMDEAVLANRVSKYHFGLGDSSPGKDQLASEINTGAEPGARTQRSIQQDILDMRTREAFVQSLAASRTPGTPLSQQEMDQIRGLTPQDYEAIRNDPKTFYEKKFAQKLIQAAEDSALHKLWDQPSSQAPGLTEAAKWPGTEFFHPIRSAAEEIITRQQAFVKVMEEREAKWSDVSLGTKLLGVGESFIPFVNTFQIHKTLGQETGDILPGNSIADTIDYLWNVPINNSVSEANRIIDGLEKVNPTLAINLARALVSYSTTNQFLDNSTLFADIGIGVQAATKIPKAFQFASAMKDLVKATSLRKFTPGDIAEATGNFNVAGQMKGLDIIRNLANRANPGSFDELTKALPGAWDIKATVGGEPSKLADERARRIAGLVMADAKVMEDAVGKAVGNPFTINRLEPGGTAEAVATANTDRIFNIQFPSAVDRILNIETVRQEQTLGGLYRAYEIGDITRAPGPLTQAGGRLIEAGRPSGRAMAGIDYKNLPPETVTDLVKTQQTPFLGKDMFTANDNIAVQFGHKDATLFTSPEAANYSAANELGLKGYLVKQRGAGWYIEYHKAVDERAIDVMNALRIETNKATPSGFANTILGWLGSNAKRMPKQLETDMLTAAYGQSGLVQAIQKATEPIRALKQDKKAYRAVQDFMSYQQNQVGPEGVRGRFSTTLNDLDKDFLDYHKRLPTDAEARAYFATTRLSDGDYILRNIKTTVEKVRNGAELHGFAHMDGTNLVKPTPSIEGKVHLDMKDIWNNKEDAGVLIWHRDPDQLNKPFAKEGDAGYFRKNYPSGGWKLKDRQDYVNDLLTNKGYRLVQLSKYGEEELRNLPHLQGKLTNRPINYVITKDLESSPLGLHQFPYRPGIHKEYPMGHYISQPNVRMFGEGKNKTAMYYGDTHYMFHQVEKDASRMTELLNQARMMMNRNDPELANFWAKNLPGKLEDFVDMFKGKTPVFNPMTPFFHKHTGSNVAMEHQLSTYYRTTHDATFQRAIDSTHNLYGNSLDLKFLGERSATLRSFSRTGDLETPAYHTAATNLIDPAASANRAFGSLIRDQYLGDLRIKLANGFVSEFGHLFDVSNLRNGLKTLQENPITALVKPPWKPGISGQELTDLAAARNYRRAAANFLALKNEGEKTEWAWKQDAVNKINELFPNKKMTLIEPYLLSSEKNVLNLAKNVAFHVTQGLMNVASLALHASVMLQAQALAGFKVGFRAMGHAFYFSMANWSEDPEVHKGIAQLAGKFENGIKPEHWLESYQAFKRSGMDAVEGEHMLRDTYFSQPMIQTRFGNFVRWTDSFFTYGVRSNRTVAWNIAYSQWRDANPAVKFTDQIATQVLQKADALSGSMTVAHRAAWQSGAFSIPTQFLAYPARIFETLWGRDFTWAERAQWMARYSATFGAPSMATVAAPIWPWHKAANEWLRNHDINVDDNMAYKFLNDGMLGIMFQMAAGQSMNVSERFGSQGGLAQAFQDTLEGRKSLLETVGGPAGIFEPFGSKSTSSLLWDTLKAGKTLFGIPLEYASNLLEGKPAPNTKIVQQQLKDVVRSFTGPNHAVNLYHAVALHKYISKNEEELLGDESARSGFIEFLTGLRPSKLDEMYEVLHDQQIQYQAQKSATDWAKKLYRSFLRSESEEDQKAMWTEMQIAIEAADLNAHDKFTFLKSMTKGTEDKYMQIMSHWAMQKQSNFDYVQKKLGR